MVQFGSSVECYTVSSDICKAIVKNHKRRRSQKNKIWF